MFLPMKRLRHTPSIAAHPLWDLALYWNEIILHLDPGASKQVRLISNSLDAVKLHFVGITIQAYIRQFTNVFFIFATEFIQINEKFNCCNCLDIGQCI